MYKRILHVFDESYEHLTPNIIKGIAKNSSFDHKFLVYRNPKGGYYASKGDVHLTDEIYSELSKSLNDSLYRADSFLEVFLKILLFRGPVILHSGSPIKNIGFSLLIWKNISWVCWGFIPRVNPGNRRFRVLMKQALVYWYLNIFSNIICLMQPDADEIRRTRKTKPIYVLPYASSIDLDQLVKTSRFIKTDNIGHLLLGNSGHRIDSYLEALEILKKYSYGVTVTCMLNYGLKIDERYHELLELGKRYFGEKFIADEKFYSKEEYSDYMYSFGIYICGVKTQTGLGAINRSLRAGLKVYLTGYNLEWIRSRGYIVFDYDDIEHMMLEEFLEPLTLKEQQYNFDNSINLAKQGIKDWDLFYRDLLSER